MTLRSFCGGVLHGEKLVRLVYLDEAGTGNPDHEPFVTVAGIIVHGDHQLNDVQKRLAKVLKKHIPQENQEGFVFHAKHLFNGGGFFGRKDPNWPIERRLAIADDLAAIPKDLRLRIALGWQERSEFLRDDQETLKKMTSHHKTLGCLAVSFLNCAVFVEQWMRKHAKNENCLMIMEDNPSARNLIRDVQNFNQNPRLVSSLDDKVKKLLPFRKIREDVLFQPKKSSSPLELADFCAFIWKRFLMNRNDKRYLRFFNQMRSQIATFSPEPIP